MVETVVNFRGLNDFTTIKQQRIRPDLIFRSGELVKVAAPERELLFDKFQIKQIYDFRSAQEISDKPDDVFTGVAYHHLDLMRDAGGHTTSLAEFSSGVTIDPDDVMKEMYADIILSKSGREGLNTFLTDLVSNEGPSLFHCFAGKDRTGVAAALFLASLQVGPDQIMRDYLVTNQARKAANDALIADYRQQGLAESALKVMETMMYVKASYLEHSFATIEEHYGSIPAYIMAKDGLGLMPDTLSDLRHQYLIAQ